jgi:hypothetical protein
MRGRRIVRDGMGNPMETPFFFDQFEDFGPCEPRQKDVVYDPSCDPMRMDPSRKNSLEELCCMLRDCLKHFVFFVKRPAYVEPPFFSDPIIKLAEKEVAASSTVDILERRVEARQRAVITAIGIEVNDEVLYGNHELVFWFEVGGVIRPIFDDQTSGVALRSGQTTIVPGSMEQPWSLRENGLTLLIRGPAEWKFRCQNLNAVTDVQVKAVATYYEHWLPKAGEFEQADIQL